LKANITSVVGENNGFDQNNDLGIFRERCGSPGNWIISVKQEPDALYQDLEAGHTDPACRFGGRWWWGDTCIGIVLENSD
jgi:hypothetical protein